MNAMTDANHLSRRPVHSVQDGPDGEDLGALFNALWRGKIWLALATLIGLMTGLTHALAVAKPTYRSTAVVILGGGPDPVVQLTDFLPTLSGDQTVVNTELEVLRSDSMLHAIVAEAGLAADPEFNAALRPPGLLDIGLDHLRDWLSIPTPPPTEAATSNRAAQALRDRMTVRNVPDSMVIEVTVETGEPDKSALLANAVVDRYLQEQLETKFDATQRATEWLAEKVAELEVDLENSEAAVNAFVAEMELISAETLEVLAVQLKDVRDRIAAREASVERGDGNARTRAMIGQLRTMEAELAEKIARQSQDLVTLEQLQREAAADRQIYEHFLGRLKETSVQEGIQQADARLLSEARPADVPTSPRPLLSGAMAGFLALLAAIALVIARELRSATFRTADDLEMSTGLPVLGQVPVIPGRRRRGVLAYIRRKPNSAAVEAIRNLRTSLFMATGGPGPKVILSTSSLPGEGKTTQTLALAQNTAGIRDKVLVIEADVRKRVFRTYFNVPDGPGLAEVLEGSAGLAEAAWHNADGGYDILFSSEISGNAADVLASPRFRRLIRQARKSYDAVLIDTPPVLLVPDARIIAAQADAVIYTVRWDKTRERQVQQGLKAFAAVGVQVTGLVLNQISPRRLKRYGYGADYGTYGTSGYYQS